MLQEKIGQITESERDEILKLQERRAGLKELLLTLDSPHLPAPERELLEKRIGEDSVRTNELFDSWWRRTAEKFNLKRVEHGRWIVDFQTKELLFEPATSQTCGNCAAQDAFRS